MLYQKTLFFFSLVDADGKVVDQSRAWCLSTGVSFHRFSPYLLTDVELDEKDDRTLVDLLWSTMAHVHSRREEVVGLSSLLL